MSVDSALRRLLSFKVSLRTPSVNSLSKMSLSACPVDMVEIFRSSEAALGVTEEAVAIGAKVVWMQLQIVNYQAAEIAESSGIKVVMDRCPKLELQKAYWTSRVR